MTHDHSLMNRRHVLLMVLCCLVLIAGLAAIYLFGLPASKVLTFGLLLFCPLSHILMMAFMGREHHQPEARTTLESGRTSAEAARADGAACH